MKAPEIDPIVNGPGPVSWSTVGHNWDNFNIVYASDAGTLVDLSSVNTLDASFDDDSGTVRYHRIRATSGSRVDLSNLTSLTMPTRGTDYLEFYLSSGGSVDLSSLSTIPGSGGYTFVDVYSGSVFALPAAQT